MSDTYIRPYDVRTQVQKTLEGWDAMICVGFRPWVRRALRTKDKKKAHREAPRVFADLIAGELTKIENEAKDAIKKCQATWEKYTKDHEDVRTPEA